MQYLSRCGDTHLYLCVVFETLQDGGIQSSLEIRGYMSVMATLKFTLSFN